MIYCPTFLHALVDLFRPIKVKERRSQVKRWGDIFFCATVRTVYLEFVETLEKDSFLNCFLRFGSRRGYPRTLTSDQGTNLTVLTPNSFLIQRGSSSPPISGVEDKKINSTVGKDIGSLSPSPTCCGTAGILNTYPSSDRHA